MAPFEWKRLGWEEVKGIPVVPDSTMGSGRFRVVCASEGLGSTMEFEESLAAT